MMSRYPFRNVKTSPEFIQLAVMTYVRFPLSLRSVEDDRHINGGHTFKTERDAGLLEGRQLPAGQAKERPGVLSGGRPGEGEGGGKGLEAGARQQGVAPTAKGAKPGIGTGPDIRRRRGGPA